MSAAQDNGRALRVVFGLTALKLLVHVIWLKPYGFFRDELYYIACADHLDWGYVDQPPFSIVLLRAWRALFGDSLASIRMLPALAGAATVLVTGLLVMELGGGALAVALGQIAVLSAGQYLSTAHYYSMNVFDQLFWVLSAYLTMRALRTRSPRDWAVLGVVLGLALLNKISVLWFGAGLFVGLLATPARETLKTPWPYLAGGIAALLFTPYVLWEVQHGWPTLEFMRNAMEHKYAPHSFVQFLKTQIDHNNPLTLPIWLAGLVALLSRRLGVRAAVLGWVFLTVFLILASQETAKAEYLSPAFAMLMAAGGVFWEKTLNAASPGWLRPSVAGILALGSLAGGMVSLPFAVAALPEEQFIAFQRALGKKNETNERREVGDLPQGYADMHGWEELADLVATVYEGLSPDEKPRATIWTRTGGYGPAAAIDFFGRSRGLPPAVSAHNNYWLWGPGHGDGSAVIVVGGDAEKLSRLFESFEQVATFECRYCRPDENHKPIYVGRRMSPPLPELWDELRNFE